MKCRGCGGDPVLYESFGEPLCGACGAAYVQFALSPGFDAYQLKFREDQIFRRWLEARIQAVRREPSRDVGQEHNR